MVRDSPGRHAPARRRLPLVAVRRHLPPILASLAGACLVGLLIYGVSAQSASRTLDELVAQGQRPRAPDATRPLPRARRPRRGVARLVPGQGRGAELLGLLVRTVPGRGAAARARQSAASQRDDATVLGVDLPGRLAGLAELRAPLPPHATPTCATTTARSPTPTAPTSCPESFVIDRHGDDRRDLARRDRPGVPQPRDRAGGELMSHRLRRRCSDGDRARGARRLPAALGERVASAAAGGAVARAPRRARRCRRSSAR